MTVLDNIYKYCLGWLVSFFWPYGWLLSPHHFCKYAPVASTSLSDQPVSVTRDITRGPIKRLNSDGSSSELFMHTQVELDKPNLRPAPEVANPNPSEGTKLAESDSIDTTEPNNSLKVEDASFGSTEVPSNNKIEGNGGTCNKKPAKSHLLEICAAQKWKPPVFECCKEEGPSHKIMFTFKVNVELNDPSNTVLECFSSPHPKAKAAAEHASEGALWYLKHLGYTLSILVVNERMAEIDIWLPSFEVISLHVADKFLV